MNMDTQRVICKSSRRRWQMVIILAAVLSFSLLLSTLGLASGDQSYSIAWWTIDDGGVTTSTGGGYSLGGAIGQPDSGQFAGNNYTLAGGFWYSTFTLHTQNLPLILR
jgi:hypothetical protein